MFVQKKINWIGMVVSLTAVSLRSSQALAGVFGLPHFVMPGEFSIGAEPEFNMTGTASVGVNLKYTQGVTDLSNAVGIVGTGGGNRQFRLGGAYSFDIIPDLESQPGVGIAFQGLYVHLADAGSFEITGIPYIHRAMKIQGSTIEPFFAVPIGLSLSSGQYTTISTAVVGALFENNEHFRTVAEFGISINNATTYLSGGFIYYH